MLSQEEKEQLQRIIAEQNKILAGAPTFAAKRAAQKVKLEAMTKLGMIPQKLNSGYPQRFCVLARITLLTVY
jgi:hypothetical protein